MFFMVVRVNVWWDIAHGVREAIKRIFLGLWISFPQYHPDQSCHESHEEDQDKRTQRHPGQDRVARTTEDKRDRGKEQDRWGGEGNNPKSRLASLSQVSKSCEEKKESEDKKSCEKGAQPFADNPDFFANAPGS